MAGAEKYEAQTGPKRTFQKKLPAIGRTRQVLKFLLSSLMRAGGAAASRRRSAREGANSQRRTPRELASGRSRPPWGGSARAAPPASANSQRRFWGSCARFGSISALFRRAGRPQAFDYFQKEVSCSELERRKSAAGVFPGARQASFAGISAVYSPLVLGKSQTNGAWLKASKEVLNRPAAGLDRGRSNRSDFCVLERPWAFDYFQKEGSCSELERRKSAGEVFPGRRQVFLA